MGCMLHCIMPKVRGMHDSCVQHCIALYYVTLLMMSTASHDTTRDIMKHIIPLTIHEEMTNDVALGAGGRLPA